MIKYVSIISSAFLAFFCNACTKAVCNETVMLRVINDDIRADGRKPEEYEQDSMRKEGNAMYIGMSLKMSPLYHRHYLIDPETCKVLDIKIDQ